VCLEDLRLGKGRFAGQPVSNGVTGNMQPIVPADVRRVALLLTFFGGVDGNSIAPSYSQDSLSIYADGVSKTIPIVTLTTYSGSILLRIEDLGQVVQMSFSGLGALSSGANCSITALPILTNAIADPIT
jgi:hypothetical protein